MKFILGIILMTSIQGCGSDLNNKDNNASFNDPTNQAVMNADQNSAQHTVIVLEVIQVENYTYLRVKEGESEIWMAVPTVDVKVGDTVYYVSGMLMTKFESKELKRTFDNILFVDRVSKDQAGLVQKKDSTVVLPPNHIPIPDINSPAPNMGSSKDSIKQNIKIAPAKNGVSIADILKNPKSFEGKIVIVKGKVTKFTSGVMGKNWVHIQDGTDYKGKFEIVITTSAEVKDGETVTFEGAVTLNKDLGFGYFFEVLMEDAKLIK